ncbi:MAG: universal stress protein [Anaerolineales bacterium]|nr:universal stress protein [Anaerolineales bacterium]
MTAHKSPLDSILVTLDGSRPSQVAAELAIQIAKKENLLIFGLHVVDELLVMDAESGWEKELGYQSGKALTADERVTLLQRRGDAALRWLEARCRTESVPVKTNLMFGGLPDLIINDAHSFRLVALGRHGNGHMQDATYLGRHFRTIVHHTSTPLLIGGEELVPVRRILLAYDGRIPAKHALTWAGLLQRIWQTQLLVLSVAEKETSVHWLKEMDSQLGGHDLENYRFLSRQGDAAVEIVTTAATENADIIIMGGHQHSALREWFTGSTLGEVLHSTALPLLVAGK